VSAASPTPAAQRHAATLAKIVATARELIARGRELTLRAVAREVGMTAPALYRYVTSHEELLQLVALDVDASATRGFERARDTQPDDDPAAQLVAAAVAFRRWALAERAEFHLVFTNPEVTQNPELQTKAHSGLMFHALLFRLWEAYRFPYPEASALAPELVQVLRHPQIPIGMDEIPEELLGLVWLFTRAWSRLYGTVTLEVYGHLDPRIVDGAMLFRAMLEEQAASLGLTEETPRLLALADELLRA